MCGADSSLWQKKKSRGDRPREGVVAMKKRLACWGMALLMLWGGQAMAQSAVVDNGFTNICTRSGWAAERALTYMARPAAFSSDKIG